MIGGLFMRLNKKIVVYTSLLLVLLAVALIFETCFATLFSGLFCSGIFVVIVALMTYFDSKRKLQFEYIDRLLKIHAKLIKFKPYKTNRVESSLSAIKSIFDNDITMLGYIIHDYDAFSLKETKKFRESYEILLKLRNDSQNLVNSTLAMYELESQEEFIQKNYNILENKIIEWKEYVDGNGMYTRNIIAETILKNVNDLMQSHNRKILDFTRFFEAVKTFFQKYKVRKINLILLYFIGLYLGFYVTLVYCTDSALDVTKEIKMIDDWLTYIPTALTLILAFTLSLENKNTKVSVVCNGIAMLLCLGAIFFNSVDFWAKYGTIVGLYFTVLGTCIVPRKK